MNVDLIKDKIGLGDVIKRVTSAIGIRTCVGCCCRRKFL